MAEAKKRALVLGAGLVGGVIAVDLSTDPRIHVTLADACEETLARVGKRGTDIATVVADCSDQEKIKELVEGVDIVVGALPAELGAAALDTVVACKKDFVDISFMDSDYTARDEVAKAAGVTVVPDCGIAPGLSAMFVALGGSRMSHIDNAIIYVGGLPQARSPPVDYRGTWSPMDVFCEYARPAMCIKDGKPTQVPAMSEPEFIDLPMVPRGETLEAFISDGIRSMVSTIPKHVAPVTRLVEKTLRYKGTRQLMQDILDYGLFSTEKIAVPGYSEPIAPFDVVAQAMMKKWKLDLEGGETEFTVMRVVVEGNPKEETAPKRVQFDLFDGTDTKNKVTSMSRCTGFTCAIVARLVLFKEITQKGVVPAEMIGLNPKAFDRVVEELKKRGVAYSMRCDI